MADVYHIRVTGEFYMLADDYQEAITAGSVLTDGFRHELPGGSETDLFAYRILRQDDEFRRRCVNFEDRLRDASTAGAKMTIPYEKVRHTTDALSEIQKILRAFGCEAFGTMFDQSRETMTVAFKWRDRQVQLEASWRGYAAMLVTKSGWKKAEAYEHARRAVGSILRDWVKGQTTAVECGLMSFETAFLPHMFLKDGRRVIDAAQAAGVIPPQSQDGPKVVEFKP